MVSFPKDSQFLYLTPLIIVPTIIFGTMAIMYRTVRKIERKMRNYESSSLRLRASQRQAAVVDDHNAPTGRNNQFLATLRKRKLVSICPCVFRNDNSSSSNYTRSQKRAFLYMAMSYSLTWVLTWIPFYILFVGISNNANVILQAVLQPSLSTCHQR